MYVLALSQFEFNDFIRIQRPAAQLTFEEKSSKSLSLAIRRDDDDTARRAKEGEAGENAAAYLSADNATEAIIMEAAGAIVEYCWFNSGRKKVILIIFGGRLLLLL